MHQITHVTRAKIKDEIIFMAEPPFYGNLKLTDFLKRIWNLSQMPSTDFRFQDAEGDIWQHMVNNADWTVEYLLDDYLKLMSAEDETVLRFIEACVHPILRLAPIESQRRINRFNEILKLDEYELTATSEISGHSVYTAQRTSGESIESGAYEVVLSFAGEQRPYVEETAGYLKTAKVRVFYDGYEEATMWGRSLVERLQEVYSGAARYCVMFISKEYRDKLWTTQERRAAFAKAVKERQEYVLPYRFDDTEIPGLNHDVLYVQGKTPRQLAELILRKLGRPETFPKSESVGASVDIIKAEWGIQGDLRDVTEHLKRLTRATVKDLNASITLFPDYWFGKNKVLIVEYRHGLTGHRTIVFKEDEPIFFPS